LKLDSIIKFFGLTINCIYIYMKILNIRDISKLKILSAIIFSAIASIVMYFFRFCVPDIRPIIILVSVFIYAAIGMRVKTDIMITAAVISGGISYGLMGIAVILSAFVFGVLSRTPNMVLASVLILILSIASTNIIFRISRLKKGFAFLQNAESGGIGIVLSGIVIIAINLIEIKDTQDPTAVLLLIGIIVCMIGMLFWWRHNLTELYRKRLNEKTIKEYEAAMAEKDKQINDMNECNDYLSKMLHRDNKLIPAMYYSVKSFLDASAKSGSADIQTEGSRILDGLSEVMQERAKMILNNQRAHKVLQSTKVQLIDSILNFMLLKASKNEIEFDFIMTESVERMTETVIQKDKLEMLLADLIENAIIATSRSTYKKILLTIGIADGCYEINVQDSGIPFEAETLFSLGLKKSTTHAGEGGSGVGYMSTFEILREAGASLIITEYMSKEYSFSKSIKIRFAGEFKYFVYSCRSAELGTYTDRANTLISNLFYENAD